MQLTVSYFHYHYVIIIMKQPIDCLVGFYGTSTFVGYLMQNPFYINKQFDFKQFTLV